MTDRRNLTCCERFAICALFMGVITTVGGLGIATYGDIVAAILGAIISLVGLALFGAALFVYRL
jgi:hypothetical protein